MTDGISTEYEVEVVMPGPPDKKAAFEVLKEELPEGSDVRVVATHVDGPDRVVAACDHCGNADDYSQGGVPNECPECSGPVSVVSL